MRNIVWSIIIVLLLSGPAMADTNYNYHDPVTYNYNPTATATGGTATGGNATIQSGAVRTDIENNIGNGLNNFSPSASAKIEKGAVQNTNVGINSNKNFQAQMQGQLQGQGQMQNNKQIIAPEQSITINNPENKRDLPGFYGYQAPGVGDYRGPYEKGVAGKVKPWTLFETVTEEQLNEWSSAFDSASCKVYPLTKKEGDKAANLSTKKSDGKPLAIIECTATSDFELFADAGKKALEAGGKSIEEMAYAITYLNKSSGWNLGFGGGVTAINGGNDNYGGSIGGGTGIGAVKVEPIAKITAIFAVK